MSEETNSEKPEFDTAALQRARQATEDIPAQIGAYRILEEIGLRSDGKPRGGMGRVFKAERRHPFKQVVAIKVIKPGFDSREVIARFESERQALARMEHPNIARVLDAGLTDAGRPYFVMEYVPGTPITEFADTNRLNIPQRLKLFSSICNAIAHAHTKSLIHRDIKSGNVLAFMQDGEPVAKVIDFGIAKAMTGDRLSDHTFNTEQGRIVGTLEYMSPEQADGSPDIDTRTDVYSLGVLLYELLTGERPFDFSSLGNKSDEEVKKMIREVAPPRPSTRLSSMTPDAAERIADVRQAKAEQYSRDLRRELEWIPLMAMRKERSRRYASPLQLAEDIENYIYGKPLRAGPESLAYRGRKFVARNLSVVISIALLSLFIVVGTSAYILVINRERANTLRANRETGIALHKAELEKVEAERQRKLAEQSEREAKTSAAVTRTSNQFLTKTLQIINARRIAGESFTVDSMIRAIDEAASSTASGSKASPDIEAALRMTIGETYEALSLGEPAAREYERAAALRAKRMGERTLPYADALHASAMSRMRSLDTPFSQVVPVLEKVLSIRKEILGPDDPLVYQTELDVEWFRKLADGQLAMDIFANNTLQMVKLLTKRKESVDALREEMRRQIDTYNDIARKSGVPAAEAAIDDYLRPYSKLPQVQDRWIRVLVGIGINVRKMEGKQFAAEAIYSYAWHTAEKEYGAGSPEAAFTLYHLTNFVFNEKKDKAQSFALLKQLLPLARATWTSQEPRLWDTLWMYATVSDDNAEVAQIMREFEANLRDAKGKDVDTAGIEGNLGRMARIRRQYEVAEKHLLSAIPGARATNNLSVLFGAMQDLAAVMQATGRFDGALKLLDEAINIARDAKVPSRVIELRYLRSQCLRQLNREPEAETELMNIDDLLGAVSSRNAEEKGQVASELRAIYEARQDREKQQVWAERERVARAATQPLK